MTQLTLQEIAEFAPNQRLRILVVLRQRNDGVSCQLLKQISSQYNARIKELREVGHNIIYDRERRGFRLLQ